MASVVITISDREDGSIGFEVAGDEPPADGELSPAHHLAMVLVSAVSASSDSTITVRQNN